MKGIVMHAGDKWVLTSETGEILFTGKTRVSCFRYAIEHQITITAYQHGGGQPGKERKG